MSSDGSNAEESMGDHHSKGDRERKETVTVTFISNYEVDPEDFDLRYRDPSKIRQELASAVIPGSDRLQETLVSQDHEMERYREEIKEARGRNGQSRGTGNNSSEASDG